MRGRCSAALLLLALASFVSPAVASTRDDAAGHAAQLARSAARRLALDASDQRMQAVRELQEACLLAPDDPRYPLALGRALAGMHMGSASRRWLRRAADLDPQDPAPLQDLVEGWRREWLKYVEPEMLDTVLAVCAAWTRLRPYSSEAWLAQVPFRIERGDLDGAALAAGRALRYGRRNAAPWLAAACVAWRRGEIERADSLFAVAVPRLHPDLRAWFAPPRGVPGVLPRPAGVPASDAGFWAPLDPDPTTPENEARLEYWSRVTHAWLLMNDPLQPGLDARAELLLRYGYPERVVPGPLDSPQHRIYNPLRASFYMGHDPGNPDYGYPYQAQAWEYPEYGMRFVLEDRALNDRYEMPIVRLDEPVPGPDLRRVAMRPDLLALGEGRVILPVLPPRGQRLEVAATFARFESDSGPRLFGQIETPGGPADSVRMRWVVSDQHGVAIARGEDDADLSACDPGARRVATFTATLPAGDYEVAVSLRDGRHRRGWVRSRERLAPMTGALAISDLVVTCPAASPAVGTHDVRLQADVGARTRGEPLTAYFEIYHLAAGADGLSRFEYTFSVVPLAGTRWIPGLAPAPARSVTREEIHAGAMRRQFLSVPVGSLPAGSYRLEVVVRDAVSGGVARSEAPFTRE